MRSGVGALRLTIRAEEKQATTSQWRESEGVWGEGNGQCMLLVEEKCAN